MFFFLKKSVYKSVYKIKGSNAGYVLNKCCEEKCYDLLLIVEENKRHDVLIKNFNIFMYDIFCHYYVPAFNTEEILKHQIKKSMVNKGLSHPRKVSM